jgi:hypothetical protein
MKKSKLRSSLVENVCVLIDFIYKNGLVALGRKMFVDLKKADSHLGDDVRLRKKR